MTLCRYLQKVDNGDSRNNNTVCKVYGRSQYYRLNNTQRVTLRRLGVTRFSGCRLYKIAKVLGVHFKAGEWGGVRGRCGSVMTTIVAGKSRYCYARGFLQVQGKCFAHVAWLSAPIYPYAPNPMTVKVCLVDQLSQPSTLISLDTVIPTNVGVEPCEDGVNFMMLRESGTDRM